MRQESRAAAAAAVRRPFRAVAAEEAAAVRQTSRAVAGAGAVAPLQPFLLQPFLPQQQKVRECTDSLNQHR